MTQPTATYTLALDPDQAALLADLLGNTDIAFDPVEDMISIPASGPQSKAVTGARGNEFVHALQVFAANTGGVPSAPDLKPFADMNAASRAALLGIAATACSWEEVQGHLTLIILDDGAWSRFRALHPEAFNPPPQTLPPPAAWYFVQIPAPTVEAVRQLVTSAGGTFFPEKHRRRPWCRCGCFAVGNSGQDVRTFQARAGPVVALTTLQICSL